MSDPPPAFDPAQVASAVMGAAAEWQSILASHYLRGVRPAGQPLDPFGILPTLETLTRRWLSDPVGAFHTQIDAWREYLGVWQHFNRRLLGLETTAVIAPQPNDRRFVDQEWEANPFFDFLKQTYLVAADALLKHAHATSGLEPTTRRKAEFILRQFADALSPTNFIATNPEVLRATLDSGGQNLLAGLRHLVADFDLAQTQSNPRALDRAAFELGRNLATTPGKVIFQNDLMQLIQYRATTPQVYRRPLLIIPGWINKYYVLDLQPENSLIRWAVAAGHTVFAISWVNPDASLCDKDFADYLREGPLAALTAIEQATGERRVNLLGHGLGGTLLGATLAYLEANADTRVTSATFLASLLDFSEVGDLKVFIDDAQVTALELQMQQTGYLDGRDLATAFNLIQANDLIWSLMINHYLLGHEPRANDVLHWNADSTRVPARLHRTILRELYLANALGKPGGMSIGDTPLDLSQVETSACFVATTEDHIAPWQATYRSATLFKGEVKFLLGHGGHVTGIVNSPDLANHGHYTGPAIKGLPAEAWRARATLNPQSWWYPWRDWLTRHGGDQVPARKPGDGKLSSVESAPGSFVRVRYD